MKVFTVVGNRPQFVKAAPLSLALREAEIEEVVLHTGQHWYHVMSQVFFDQLGIAEPRYRLDLHSSDAAEMQPAIAERIAAESPDLVLVYGDTNSTLAGARAAADASRAPRPRRGRTAQRRPHDAGGAQPDRDRSPCVAPLPPRRPLASRARERKRPRAPVRRGRRDGRREPDLHPDRTGALSRSTPPRSYVVATIHRQANVEQPRLGHIVDGLNRHPGHGRLPCAPTDASSHAGGRAPAR